jgi:hypothetical protein
MLSPHDGVEKGAPKAAVAGRAPLGAEDVVSADLPEGYGLPTDSHAPTSCGRDVAAQLASS